MYGEIDLSITSSFRVVYLANSSLQIFQEIVFPYYDALRMRMQVRYVTIFNEG